MRVALSLIALLLQACTAEEPAAAPELDPRPARIHEVQAAATVVRHRFVGRVEAMQTVDLSFERGGPLVELSVREGARVPAGRRVAAIDPLDHELAVREARAQLELAGLDLERKRGLLAGAGISRAAVDEAATLLELRAVALARAEEALADTRLVAPFDAYVARRFVDPGVNVRAGEPVLRLLDLSRLRIVASVREDLLATVDAAQVQAMQAEFAFLPGRAFPLTILENRGEADPIAQTYEIGFALPAPDGVDLLPGMTAAVVVDLRSPEAGGAATAVIPVSALVADADRHRGFHVWRFDPASGAVSRRPVVVGALSDTAEGAAVRVLEGLVPGELIVSAGAGQLAEGMRVRPLTAGRAP